MHDPYVPSCVIKKTLTNEYQGLRLTLINYVYFSGGVDCICPFRSISHDLFCEGVLHIKRFCMYRFHMYLLRICYLRECLSEIPIPCLLTGLGETLS